MNKQIKKHTLMFIISIIFFLGIFFGVKSCQQLGLDKEKNDSKTATATVLIATVVLLVRLLEADIPFHTMIQLEQRLIQ